MKRTGPPKRRKAPGPGKPSANPKRPRRRPPEPGEEAWKASRRGKCAVCCKKGALILHHLVREQDIRLVTTEEQQSAGIVWDLRNALPIGAPLIWGGRCSCHADHHHWTIQDRRIPFELVRPESKVYAIEVLGEGPASEHWHRYYKDAPS